MRERGPGQPAATGQPATTGQPVDTGQTAATGEPAATGQPAGSINRIVVLGAAATVRPFGLAGATILVADGPDAQDRALERLPGDTRLLILTPEAATRLRPQLEERPGILVAVLPGPPHEPA